MNSLLTDPANHPANSPLPVQRIERVIEALESSLSYRNGSSMDHFIADAVKGLRELREVRKAKGEPVMYCSAETIAAARDGEHLLRTLSAPSGDCVIPLYSAPPAPVVPDTLPLSYLQGHQDGLEWAAQMAEANHPQTGDWLYDDPIALAAAIRKGPDMPLASGNSPVTPDGWVMVPIVPTMEMLDEFDSIIDYGAEDSNDAWSRLISVAPKEVG